MVGVGDAGEETVDLDVRVIREIIRVTHWILGVEVGAVDLAGELLVGFVVREERRDRLVAARGELAIPAHVGFARFAVQSRDR